MSNGIVERRSSRWLILPIVLAIVGIIAYFALRYNDAPKAKNSPHLAKSRSVRMSNGIVERRSSRWLILPIVLSAVGSIIAYLALRYNDAPKAKNSPHLAKSRSVRMSNGIVERRRSSRWLILPIVLSAVGSIIAYFALRYNDAPKAKNCLYLGIAVAVAEIVLAVKTAAEIVLAVKTAAEIVLAVKTAAEIVLAVKTAVVTALLG